MSVCRPNAVFARREGAGTVGRAEEVDSMQRKVAAEPTALYDSHPTREILHLRFPRLTSITAGGWANG